MVTEVTVIQSQRPRNRKWHLLLTGSDASDEEADVSHAWTADLARYKDENPVPETENPLTW